MESTELLGSPLQLLPDTCSRRRPRSPRGVSGFGYCHSPPEQEIVNIKMQSRHSCTGRQRPSCRRRRDSARCHNMSSSTSCAFLSVLLLFSSLSVIHPAHAADHHDTTKNIDAKMAKFQKAAMAFGGYAETGPRVDTSLFCATSRHVHLAVGHDPTTSMTVSFSSEPCDFGTYPPPKAGVMIGTSPDKMDRLVLESSPPKQYNATIVAHKHTVRESYTLYKSEYQRHVTITGLRPDTKYYYRCVTLKEGGGAMSLTARPNIREEEDVVEAINAQAQEQVEEHIQEHEKEQLWEQIREEEIRDGGEEDDIRRKLGDAPLLRANCVPPPAYRNLQPGDDEHNAVMRMLHMNPKQTMENVDKHIEKAENKIEKGQLKADGHSSFTTAPVVKAGDYKTPTQSPVKFAIIGDVAQTEPALVTLAHLNDNSDDITSVLLVGDIAYANKIHHLWDSWFDMIDMYGRTFHHKPLMVAPGNHEVEQDSAPTGTHEIFASYEARFHMPQVKPKVGGVYLGSVGGERITYPLPYDFGNAYYSFKQGPTHNIVLNSFADQGPNSLQYGWLVKELESIDREITPWVTVTIHCPLYNTFKWHRNDPQSIEAVKHLEGLFYKFRVNFVLSGHLHAYMRTKPMHKNRPNDKGPIHVILGNGGRQANTPYKRETPESWIAVRDHTTFGYSTIEFVNNTHARYEWIQTDVNKVSTGKVHLSQTKAPVDIARHKGIRDKLFIENQLYIS